MCENRLILMDFYVKTILNFLECYERVSGSSCPYTTGMETFRIQALLHAK